MKMKKFTLIALSFGLITSCSEDGVSGFSENLSTTTVMETINSIAFEEDIDELVSESMNLNSNASSARSADTTADKGPKKFMGKEYDGINRTTFVIDEKGIIEDIISKVNTKEHTNQILK